jgi:hypothetical protein
MEIDEGAGVEQAAQRAGMHRNTARRHLASGRLPSERRERRTYRTRPDPFEADWEDLEARLEETPELEAQTLFEDLRARRPGAYADGHLRTLQRRVKAWRARRGPDREVFFPQEHRPGEASQTDFTHAAVLGITIRGEPYPHQLCHFALPYSNWSWATPCRSESMAALFEGMQEGLWRLGGAPAFSQTDNSTAATHDLRSGKRGFNAEYVRLVSHYGMRARTTGVGEKEQNGDVESMNGALKRYLEQQLLLRGSRDFESHAAYRTWLAEALERRNALREPRITEERAALRPLPCSRLPSFREIVVRVGQGSTIRVMGHPYSVPPRLRGERVSVRVHETRIEVLFAGELQAESERPLGRGGHGIQYRHVIGSLVRKPGAFRLYRYRDAMFPTETFRRTHERIARDLSAWASDVEYLRILHLAATTMEADVEAALRTLLAAGTRPTFDLVRASVAPPAPSVPVLEMPSVDLTSYDAILETEVA